MEETAVAIVGAGPSGLALALSLAKHRVYSIVLEKTKDITEDPRGVYLTGDAVRIFHDLGIGDQMASIGHEVPTVNFHKSTIIAKPFYTLDVSGDVHSQTVSGGILQEQPKLEKVLRARIADSEFCQLRCGSNVESREKHHGYTIIKYYSDGVMKSLKCSWLVGADGKTGVVRKHFLEKSAGIRQEDSSYKYEGTWIASNLKITLPTSKTHPNFPLWRLGFTPQGVYDLFFPIGWHFCSPPGKATAAGRFGAHEERLWRHEFEQGDWNDSMDAEKLLWEHLMPMLTRDKDSLGSPRVEGEVIFPIDCVEIMRCRPFRFSHKVVNRWFDDRTILIGDAAHVFPPFGGQGIASGVRDAHQLAWRLALLLAIPNATRIFTDMILNAWAIERRQNIDDAATFTRINGTLCNYQESWWFYAYRRVEHILSYVEFLPKFPNVQNMAERTGFKRTSTGFFLHHMNGGGRIAQIYLESSKGQCLLSDEILKRGRTIFTLIVIGEGNQDLADAKKILSAAKLHPSVLSIDSIVVVYPEPIARKEYWWIDVTKHETYTPVPLRRLASLSITPRSGYNEKTYFDRLGKNSKFAIVRPDFYIFSVARNTSELAESLIQLKTSLTWKILNN